MEYKKGDICEFVNDGTLLKGNNKRLNSLCKIISKHSDYPKNYRVVFQDENYYTIIGEVFLVKTQKAITYSRQLKLNKINEKMD